MNDHPNPEPTCEVYSPHKMPRGTVATLGHPDNKILIVRTDEFWRYVDSGEVVDPEDFRAGWDIYIPESDEPYEDDEMVPQLVGHPDNAPVGSENVLSGYKNLMYSINRVNRGLHPNQRFVVPLGVQEALARYIGERQAIESITKQKDEERKNAPWP